MREIDPAWWRSAAFDTRPLIAYLRERDFGAVFRFLRSRGWSRSTIAAATGLSETRVREISVGRQRVTSYEVLERIALGLNIDRGLLGIAYDRDPFDEASAAIAADARVADARVADARIAGPLAGTPGPDAPEPATDQLGLSLLATPPPSRVPPAIQGLVDVLTDWHPRGREGASQACSGDAAECARSRRPEPIGAVGAAGLSGAERATAAAKRNYQDCRYDAVLRDLPSLLVALARLQGETGEPRADALAAHAYHVAGSVLLKVGEPALAAVAADRSMHAAQRSGDPIAVAASARIVTHTLMSAGHNERARYLAITAADELVREVSLSRSGPARSVYGALLLRASVACARDDGETAYELLDDADAIARTLPDDANERWTAFGPSNVLLHRVNVALALGDAGSAIRTARRVDLGRVTLAERKASLFLDVARAFHQCGRHDEAFDALAVAHRTAPEEIRSRPSAERFVTEMASTAPRSTVPRIHRFARSAGITL